MVFFGIASLCMMMWYLNWFGFFGGILMFVVTTLLYIPITMLTKAASND
jgi:hypothetical protein